MGRYWILREGRKVFHETLQGISDLAHAEANRLGKGVTVYTGDHELYNRAIGRIAAAAKAKTKPAQRPKRAKTPTPTRKAKKPPTAKKPAIKRRRT